MEADLCTETSSWKAIFHGCCLVLGQAVVFCHRNVMFTLKGPTQEAFLVLQSNISESRHVVILLAIKFWLAFLNKVLI